MEDFSLNRAVKVKWILKKRVGKFWMGHIWLSAETSTEQLWKSNKISGQEFIDYVEFNHQQMHQY